MTPESTRPPAALITGAATGVGMAVAERFVRDGRRVLLADCDPTVHELAQRLCPLAQARVMHLEVESEVLALARYAREDFGGCEILVNNAGIRGKSQVELMGAVSVADWELVMRANLTAAFLLCRELIPAMRQKRWGRVVNVASRSGRTYVKESTLPFSTSMAALIGITRQLGGENAQYGITVNSVAPDPLDRPASPTYATRSVALGAIDTPIGRLGTSQELAEAIAFLVSEEAAYITGACLDVNGGSFIG